MQIIKPKFFELFSLELTYIEFCLRINISIVLRKKAAINTNIFRKKNVNKVRKLFPGFVEDF